jgi:hypothetical protein
MRLQIAGVIFICTMLYLVNYEGRSRYEDMGISQVEERRIEEADRTRRVALLDEQDRKSELERHHPSPRAHNLGNGSQGDIPIGSLMEGLRGFL